jgi:hypothetical protein
MHANNGGVDHLDSSIVSTGKRVYDAAPDTSPPPADETVIAGRVRTKMIRQIAPRCPDRRTQKMPLRTRRSFTRGTPRGLFGSIGLMVIREFVAHDSSPQFGSLNHEGLANANSWRGPGFGAYGQKRTLTNRQSLAETDEMTRIRLRRSNLCGRAISTGHATTPFPRRRPRHE